jgi:hypothetical protein
VSNGSGGADSHLACIMRYGSICTGKSRAVEVGFATEWETRAWPVQVASLLLRVEKSRRRLRPEQRRITGNGAEARPRCAFASPFRDKRLWQRRSRKRVEGLRTAGNVMTHLDTPALGLVRDTPSDMRAESPPVSGRIYTARVYSRTQPGRTYCVENSGNGRATPLDVGGMLRGERSTYENVSGRHTRRVSNERC